MREYRARARGLTNTIEHHGVEVPDEELRRQILKDLAPRETFS